MIRTTNEQICHDEPLKEGRLTTLAFGHPSGGGELSHPCNIPLLRRGAAPAAGWSFVHLASFAH